MRKFYDRVMESNCIRVSEDKMEVAADFVKDCILTKKQKYIYLHYLRKGESATEIAMVLGYNSKSYVHRVANNIIDMIRDNINYENAILDDKVYTAVGISNSILKAKSVAKYSDMKIKDLIEVYNEPDYEYKCSEDEAIALVLLKKFPFNPNLIKMHHLNKISVTIPELRWYNLLYNPDMVAKYNVQNYPYLFMKNFKFAFNLVFPNRQVGEKRSQSVMANMKMDLDCSQIFRIIVNPIKAFSDDWYFGGHTLDARVYQLYPVLSSKTVDYLMEITSNDKMTIKDFIHYCVDPEIDDNINTVRRLEIQGAMSILKSMNEVAETEYEEYKKFTGDLLEAIS